MIFNCCDDNPTIRIIVLTYNRPLYLFRLLRSIEEADYNFQRNNPHWNLVLEIRIDVGSHKLVHSPLYTKRRKEKVIIILIEVMIRGIQYHCYRKTGFRRLQGNSNSVTGRR